MKKIIALLLFISFISSCVQQSYIVNSPNVNCFEYEKEKNLKLVSNGKCSNIQYNFALNDKFGIASSLNGGFGKNKSYYYGSEVGGIYYNYFNSIDYFEFQSGLGYCNNKLERDGYIIINSTRCNYYTDAQYYKFYLQPSILYLLWKKNIRLCFATKFNAIYFTSYNFHYISEYVGGTSIRDEEEAYAYFSDKMFYTVEPSIILWVRNIFFIQFGGIVPSKVKATEITIVPRINSYASYKDYSFLKTPQTCLLNMNIGIQFKLGKDKKPITYD